MVMLSERVMLAIHLYNRSSSNLRGKIWLFQRSEFNQKWSLLEKRNLLYVVDFA